jgi:hypothetical protein
LYLCRSEAAQWEETALRLLVHGVSLNGDFGELNRRLEWVVLLTTRWVNGMDGGRNVSIEWVRVSGGAGGWKGREYREGTVEARLGEYLGVIKLGRERA